MNIKFSPPDIGEDEITAVAETLRSGWITTGPKSKLFENKISKFCGTEKTVCLNSATAGLELTLKILGVGDGDEVITSAYTYTASASVIQHVGAKIVLCDTQKDSYAIDYDKLENLITSKTKVIIPVDIAGVMCDYDKIFSIVETQKSRFKPSSKLQELFGRIIVLADAAHSFGATYKGLTSGSVADFSSFSFHAVKNLTTGEGGAVTWKSKNGLDNEWLYHQFMLWSLHGQSKDALAKNQLGSWEYDIQLFGQKCNMTDIMASIGLVQLSKYGTILKRRKEIVEMYDAALKGKYIIGIDHFNDLGNSSAHLYLSRVPNITLEQRNEIINKMAEKGIATNVHYKPLPMHTAYKALGFDIKNYPNAYSQFLNEITLPLHTLLTNEEIQYVIKSYIMSITEVK